ncbi:MAG: RpiB/LacA/LacB family sugar-phosphate isomerase [Chloroflexota bacterium]
MGLSVAIAADHGGFDLKSELLPWLKEQGFEVLDLGAASYDALDDYPDFAVAVARAVAGGRVARGIIICGSGVGAGIVANKIAGVRAAICHDTYSARQGTEHDDMNVLCLGARVIGPALARELVLAFLGARFSSSEKYRRRLAKVLALEARTPVSGKG